MAFTKTGERLVGEPAKRQAVTNAEDVYKRQGESYATGRNFGTVFIYRRPGDVSIPVSYTHLDVYKRQVLSRPIVWLLYNTNTDSIRLGGRLLAALGASIVF